MKLEKQVVSLELAKKMRELGFKQESLFVHFKIHSGAWKIGGFGVEPLNGTSYSAYTVAELGEMLPHRKKYWTEEQTEGKWSNDWRLNERLSVSSEGSCYILTYVGDDDEIFRIQDKKEADARAKMLIFLAENNLITL